MSKVKVAAFSVSLDGYGAGLDQSKENPLGKRGEELHEWIFPTKMFKKMYGKGEYLAHEVASLKIFIYS